MPDSPTITLARHGDQPAPDVVVPRQLGSVRLVRELGKGGMGVVWLGHDDMLARQVAVKFLLAAAASPDDPEFETFITGAQAAAALKHPGLTAIHHAGLIEHIPYLVMEFIDGPSLDQLIRQTGALPLPIAMLTLRSVCAAIGELHDHAITHRDVKPANILLDPDARVVVTDFGLSCQRQFGEVRSRLAVAGTPRYMPPEMYEGDISPRSDVYALGILAFELFTGAPPFEGSPAKLRERHGVAPLPSERLAAFPPELTAAIERATNKNPRLRYRTAHHFNLALDSVRVPDFAEHKAVAELRRRVAVCRGHVDALAAPTSQRDTPSYYQSLSSIAVSHRTKPRQDPLPPYGAPQPTMDTIAHPIPCVACSYNLHGLDPAAGCPECGSPVARSIAPDRLFFANPAWLQRVIRGQQFLIAGAATYLALSAAFPILRFPTTYLGVAPIPLPGQLAAAVSAALTGVILILIGLVPVGAWLFTAPEPIPRRGHIRILRLLARWATIITCAVTAVLIVFPDVQTHGSIYRTLGILGSSTLIVSTLCITVHFHSLARRCDPTLLRSARVLVLVISTAVVLWFMITAASYLWAPSTGVSDARAPQAPADSYLTRARGHADFALASAAIYSFMIAGLGFRRFRLALQSRVPHDSLCRPGLAKAAPPPTQIPPKK